MSLWCQFSWISTIWVVQRPTAIFFWDQTPPPPPSRVAFCPFAGSPELKKYKNDPEVDIKNKCTSLILVFLSWAHVMIIITTCYSCPSLKTHLSTPFTIWMIYKSSWFLWWQLKFTFWQWFPLIGNNLIVFYEELGNNKKTSQNKSKKPSNTD